MTQTIHAFPALDVDAIVESIAARVAERIKNELGTTRIAPRWLDFESAAQLMNTTKAAVRGMARSGLFPVKKMGGRVMIDIRDLEKAFEQRTEWLR